MEESQEMQVGKVTHYFTKIGVAVIEVTDGSIKAGDELHIKGHTSNFMQKVDSLQIEHEKIQVAEPGQSIGIKVDEHARAGDLVYKRV